MKSDRLILIGADAIRLMERKKVPELFDKENCWYFLPFATEPTNPDIRLLQRAFEVRILEEGGESDYIFGKENAVWMNAERTRTVYLVSTLSDEFSVNCSVFLAELAMYRKVCFTFISKELPVHFEDGAGLRNQTIETLQKFGAEVLWI
jgi:hypothetical protein